MSARVTSFADLTSDNGLLVVERIDHAGRSPAGMTRQQVVHRYKGIDGALWPGDETETDALPLHRGLAGLSRLDRVRSYVRAVRTRSKCDLLLVERRAAEQSTQCQPVDGKDHPIQSQVGLLGYDLGFVEGPDNNYSLLYHEVIHPRFPDLGRFAIALNQNLLAPSLDVAQEILSAQRSLEQGGASFETTVGPEICDTLAVYEFAERALA